MNNLKKRVSDFVTEFKKNNHLVTCYADFVVTYYAVNNDGSVVITSSTETVGNSEWGVIEINYGAENYRGYIDSITTSFVYSKEGIIGTNIPLGKCEIDKWLDVKINGISVHCPSNCTQIRDKLKFIAKLLPWLQNCDTEKEVKEMIERVKNNEVKSIENMSSEELILRNKKLEKKVAELESKLAKIVSIMNI